MDITVENLASGVTKVKEKDGRLHYFTLGANIHVDKNGTDIYIQGPANEGATVIIPFADLATASKQSQASAEALGDYWSNNSFFLQA